MIGLLRSEWVKLRSVRSTMWTMTGVVLVMIVFAYLNGAMSSGQASRHPVGAATQVALGAAPFASLIVASMGVLAISGEYRTGMIRTTLLAVPRRGRMLTAKAAVFAAFVFAVCLPACLVAFLVGQAALGSSGVGLGAPGVVRMIVGCALYLTGAGLLGLGLGTVVRHTAGGVVTVMAALFILPQLIGMLPNGIGARLMPYVTSVAGVRIMSSNPGVLSPWAGFGVFCLWAAGAMLAALILLRRRDA
ncbi:MAG: ABC transporter permease subunit [Nonomuraea sp.]|nr:ABC transporter permease subunit [Nonomuraea sp.]